tara:strand:+ start:2583 stop:3599 length:1017 start_codon:yes stop_codon:yes gene_type:complete
MKTYKKGRPSKRKVGKKNGPSKKNKLRKKNKTKKMKKIKGGGIIKSTKCIPVFTESGNVKRAMQNILCGLDMYIKNEVSKPYGEDNYVKMDTPITGNHIEVLEDNGEKNIIITDMLYRHEKEIINHGADVEVDGISFQIGVLKSNHANNGKKNDETVVINMELGSIPTGKKTDNKTTYTRDDVPQSFHNTPIFYHINGHTDLEVQTDDFRIEQLQTYEKALDRLRTNSVCQGLLTGTNIDDYTFTYKLRNDYKYSDKYIGQFTACADAYRKACITHGKKRNDYYRYITEDWLKWYLERHPKANMELQCVRNFKKHYGITGSSRIYEKPVYPQNNELNN